MKNPINATVAYVRSSIAELQKVTWPTRQATIRYASLVIVVSVVLAVLFAMFDFGFSRGIMYVLTRGRTAQTQESAPVAPVVPTTQETPQPTEATTPVTSPTINIDPTDVQLKEPTNQ